MLFWRCLLLGFSIAAPLGPIGVLCLQTTARSGRSAGLRTGLGAATADAVYGAVAACGITLITSTVTAADFWLKLAGGAFLLWMGAKTLLAAGRPQSPPALTRPFAGTFLLTLTNPMTILSFAAMFGSLGATGQPLVVVAGVFAGSMLWWAVLVLTAGLVLRGGRCDRALSVLSGAVLVAFGLSAWWRVGQ